MMADKLVVPFHTERVVSADGTVIGYRQYGHGPGLVLLHGGMMASQNFASLAADLSDEFTVYVPDRRGRGLSGPHGDHYSLARECEDVRALVGRTGAQNLFGLSSGALVALGAALELPNSIRRLAVYEPPLPVNGFSPAAWASRSDAEIARGDLASAMLTIIKGTDDSPLLTMLPRFIMVPLLRMAIKADAREAAAQDVPIEMLIPTMRFDPQLVMELEGKLNTFARLSLPVLLLGGSRSQRYLKAALDALAVTLPDVRRVELPGVGHLAAENGGRPQRVAHELRHFFLEDPS